MLCTHCGEMLERGFAFCPSCGNVAQLDPFVVGAVLRERYQINRLIGKGGYGVVYEATELSASRRVAIKLLNTKSSSNLNATARFLREARIILALKHPNLIEAYELGDLDDRLWLVMEFLEGETLAAYIKRNGPPRRLPFLALLGPVCRGLEAAHHRGIVHRDLKSSNIMMARTPRGMIPKILDFGLASLQGTTSLTDTSTVSGTPRYMAPEQWRGLKFVGPPTDIYALGVLVYHALSGRYPFEADTPMSWMKKHCIDPPRELQSAMGDNPLPEAVCKLVMQALAKQPAERPSSPIQFFEELCRGFREANPRDTINTETVEFPSTEYLLSERPNADTLLDEPQRDTIIEEKP